MISCNLQGSVAAMSKLTDHEKKKAIRSRLARLKALLSGDFLKQAELGFGRLCEVVFAEVAKEVAQRC